MGVSGVLDSLLQATIYIKYYLSIYKMLYIYIYRCISRISFVSNWPILPLPRASPGPGFLRKVLLSVSSLLTDPNFDDPLNGTATHDYRKDRVAYEKKCRDMTHKHAMSAAAQAPRALTGTPRGANGPDRRLIGGRGPGSIWGRGATISIRL